MEWIRTLYKRVLLIRASTNIGIVVGWFVLCSKKKKKKFLFLFLILKKSYLLLSLLRAALLKVRYQGGGGQAKECLKSHLDSTTTRV